MYFLLRLLYFDFSGHIQALKEKTELQAQLAALNMKLQAQVEHSQNSQQKQESLSSEVATLKQSCWDLERAMADLQNALEAKNASLASSNNDLQLAEEQYQRLLLKVEDMQKNVLTRDSTGGMMYMSIFKSCYFINNCIST